MIWQQLKARAQQLDKKHLSVLFAEDKKRAERYRIGIDGLLFDYCKQKVDDKTLALLIKLATEKNLKENIKQLFAGDIVNISENKSAQHCLLRDPNSPDFVQAVLEKMAHFSRQINQGHWRSFSGERITDVVNIGVGGSDLGPKMVCHALRHLAEKDVVNLHFVSSMDGEQLAKTLRTLLPERTLFIVSSKSFQTPDTMENFALAKRWLLTSKAFLATTLTKESAFKQHFVAVTANEKLAEQTFDKANIFLFWPWVGGRFSLWSSIGLPIVLALGMPTFRQLLAGAYAMDKHFKNTALTENIPVLMALIEVWNADFLQINNRAILPYSASFAELPSYLSQLEMESLGKSVNQNNQMLDYATGSIILGEVGSNAQHAFYQLLHQGSHRVSMDFIALVNGVEDNALNQLSLLNCLAQSQALAFGDANDNLAKHYRGDKPSNTLLLDELSAKNLGQLLALYEHKVFVQSVIWQINAFDQWGVELGKRIVTDLLSENTGKKVLAKHVATQSLLTYIKEKKC